MWLPVVCAFFVLILTQCNAEVSGDEWLGFRKRDCDVPYAYRVLKDHSHGRSYCEEHCRPPPPYTKTVTTTVDVSATTCGTTTITTTNTRTIRTTTEVETTLPVITKTSYSSTVLIASGTHRPINHNYHEKRLAERLNEPDAALQGCSHDTVDRACSSLAFAGWYPTTTKTVTVTIACTSTVQATTRTRTTITSTYTFSVSPPPVVVTTTGVLTTTVPYQCAQEAYKPHGNGNPSNLIESVAYPYFAFSAVECCVVCYGIDNCVASGYIASGEDCQLLIRPDANGNFNTSSGTGACTAPGLPEDYPFRKVHPKRGGAFPGPCGY